jgi:AraC-like DNA-binding protein
MERVTSSYTTDQSTAGALRRFESAGADPRQASVVYSDAYGGGHLDVRETGAGFNYRYAYLGDERVTLRTSECSGILSGDVLHLEEYVVGWFRQGTGTLDLRRATRQASESGEPLLLPAERRFALEFGPHRQNLIHFAPDFLEGVATELHAGPRQPISFDATASPDPDLIGRWRSAVSEATQAIARAGAGPLVRLAAELDLARVLLRLFPWRAWDVPDTIRTPSAWRTRLALDFLHHHAHEPISPSDAAAAAGVHTRTLQQATRLHYGVSPSTYLRDIRLDRVHRELLEADPGATTVAAVGREWGFGNLGRFAAVYAARFGERPKETLRR